MMYFYITVIFVTTYTMPVNAFLSLNVKLGIIHKFCKQHKCSSTILLDISGQRSGNVNARMDSQLVRYMSQQYSQVIISSVNELKSCMQLHNSAGRKPLIVLSYNASSHHHNFLRQCSKMEQYGEKNVWLLISTTSQLSQLFDVSHLNVPFNSNFFIISHDETHGIQLSEVYALGPNSTLQQDIIATWGTKSTDITFPNLPYKYSKVRRRSNMQRYKLVATSVSANEFYTNIKKINGKFQIVGGYFGETFKTLAQVLNFTYSIKFHPGYGYGVSENLTWTGVLGDIQRGDANITACEVSAIGSRLTFMDFTIPLRDTVRRLYVQQGLKKLEMDSYFRPFEMSIWIAFILTLLLFTTINTAFYRIIHKTTKTQRRLGILSNMFIIMSIILLQGTEYPANTSIRLVLQTCAMLFLIVHTAYSAKLTVLAMLYKPPPSIHDIADLLKSSSWRFGLINGSLEYNIFKNAERNSLQGNLWLHKLQSFSENLMNDYESGLSEVLKDGRYVFLGIEDSSQDILQNIFTSEQMCRVLSLSKVYFTSGLTLALQKNSPYKEIVNYSLMKMRSNGILHRLKSEWLSQSKECSKSNWIITDWLDIMPPITGYCIMFIASICILIGELLLHNHMMRNTVKSK